MNCPACNADSLAPYIDPQLGLEVDACRGCDGMWFDAKELARFLESASLKQTFGVEEKQKRGEASFTINTEARKCPRCTVDMEERLFGGVTLDRCPGCEGLWFDGGELQTVVARYRKGARGDHEIASELRAGLGTPAETGAAVDDQKAAMLASVKDFLASLGVKDEA